MACCQFCRIFCCPPCIPQITAKLAFMPPTPSHYSLEKITAVTGSGSKNTYRILLAESVFPWPIDMIIAETLCEVGLQTTSRGNTIVCLFIPYKDPKMRLQGNLSQDGTGIKTILHSHGNATDIGSMLFQLYQLSQLLEVNIATYDYSGYGQSTGRPSEKNLYADVECALSYFLQEYKLSPSDIILYGQSIGTVPTMHMASGTELPVDGVLLHSPFTSGLRLVCGTKLIRHTFCWDPFKNLDRAPNIRARTLVIHGAADTLVPVNHACLIQASLPNPVHPPLIIKDATHNDCDMFPDYLQRLYDFIHPPTTSQFVED